jgi:hypothetical protein
MLLQWCLLRGKDFYATWAQYYAASVRSPARWHSRGSYEHWRCERSLISHREVRATRSCLLYAGRAME